MYDNGKVEEWWRCGGRKKWRGRVQVWRKEVERKGADVEEGSGEEGCRCGGMVQVWRGRKWRGRSRCGGRVQVWRGRKWRGTVQVWKKEVERKGAGVEEGSGIFFRTGAISRLEEQRDLVLSDVIIHFQAHCRGYLARKRLEKRKVQETAIRCIQKNVRKFIGVRDWPWWRLLVRVTPLLNVHRTEEELRTTKDELETLRARLDKAEKERTTLKHDNEKLEARVSPHESKIIICLDLTAL
ncbi:hypothetical protein Pcinc_038760 [Petrolisthes cinctipes]|uniref:Myosin heavy chain n=1 Tax=Petrolisthes cinctipes TaxID=88211 RepID=A0AAE1BPT7_PETCI|nr:hypothetical protein Pcinc_038760 [Petrolisthes cinctipes]